MTFEEANIKEDIEGPWRGDVGQWGSIKIKHFCSSEDINGAWKALRMGENICKM
jgi:hypothetical protein